MLSNITWHTCTRPALPYFEQQDDDSSQMREVPGQSEDVHCCKLEVRDAYSLECRFRSGKFHAFPLVSVTASLAQLADKQNCRIHRIENMARVQVDVEGGVAKHREGI